MRRLALAAVIAACGAPATPPPAPAATPAPTRAAAHVGYLVWTAEPHGASETVWVDPDGVERGRAAGVVIALEGALWRVQRRGVQWQPPTCTELRGRPGPRGDGGGPSSAMIVELVSLDGRESRQLNEPFGGGDGVSTSTHTAHLTGGAGPFLFALETTFEDLCAERAPVIPVASTFDLVGDHGLDPLVHADDLPALTAAARAALVAEANASGAVTTSDVWLRETLPRWRADGLALDHRFVMSSCVTCGDGEWQDGYFSTIVPARTVPPRLAETVAALPPPVLARLAAATAPAGVTSGAPDDAWRATFAP